MRGFLISLGVNFTLNAANGNIPVIAGNLRREHLYRKTIEL